MRHGVKGSKLGRTASHRRATLNSLATALLKHKKIRTTITKAKAARSFVEKLITKAKVDSVHARRQVARFINDNDIVKELFTEIVTKVGDRPGGYTRVVKLGHRAGDAAEMAILELVDYGEVSNKEPKAKKVVAEKPAPKVTEKVIEEAKVVEETKEVAETKTENSEEAKPEVQ